MEQSKVCETASRRLSDELVSVYELINAYRNDVNANDPQAEKTKSRNLAVIATFVVLTIIGGLYAALYFLPPSTWGDSTEGIRLVLQFILLFVYILGGGVTLLQYFAVKDVYKDFTGQIIDGAADSAKDEAALFEAFDDLSTQAIGYVANRLEHTSIQLGHIRSFLLGAIEKIGIIPGLLVTVIAINKIAGSTGVSWIELLSFIMLGFYMSMFPITEAAINTKRISDLLNQYLVLFRSSEEKNRELQQNTLEGAYEHVNKN
jgi:hypothetical protein